MSYQSEREIYISNPIVADNKPVKVNLLKGQEYYFCTWNQWGQTLTPLITISFSKNKLKVDKMLAITKKENLPSVNFLEKTGFKYESGFSHPESTEKLALYSIG